jgi:hypothetical protein
LYPFVDVSIVRPAMFFLSIVTVHWRNYSTQYDSKRAVQQPTANPGTGHRMKRSRQDDETQYQYRKWKVEQERLQTPEETDARVENKNKYIMYIFYLFYFTCIFSLHHDNLHNYFSTTFYIA